jgi:hypothetical protein
LVRGLRSGFDSGIPHCFWPSLSTILSLRRRLHKPELRSAYSVKSCSKTRKC